MIKTNKRIHVYVSSRYLIKAELQGIWLKRIELLQNVLVGTVNNAYLIGKIVVVLFMLYQNAYRIIRHVHHIHLEDIIWIGSDGITGRDPPKGLEDVMSGTLGLTLETLEYPGFSQYINK